MPITVTRWSSFAYGRRKKKKKKRKEKEKKWIPRLHTLEGVEETGFKRLSVVLLFLEGNEDETRRVTRAITAPDKHNVAHSPRPYFLNAFTTNSNFPAGSRVWNFFSSRPLRGVCVLTRWITARCARNFRDQLCVLATMPRVETC